MVIENRFLQKSLGVFLDKLLGVILIALMLFTTFLMFIQVVLRYVFHAPLMGIEELLNFPAFWLYVLGAAGASLQRNHIKCEILSVYIKKAKTLAILNITRSILNCALLLWILKWAYWLLAYSLRVNKTSALLYIPMKYVESALFVGIVLMLVFSLIELFEQFIHLKMSKAS